MTMIIQSPGRYIQGVGVLARLGEYLAVLGARHLIIGDSFVLEFAEPTLKTTCASAQLYSEIVPFGGECCQPEIDRLQAIARHADCRVITGIGGGKTLDTAKAVAHALRLPVAIVPTIASTDAPCSALSVIYTPQGEFDRYLMLPRNPDCVIVDTQIVANAPAQWRGDDGRWPEHGRCHGSRFTVLSDADC